MQIKNETKSYFIWKVSTSFQFCQTLIFLCKKTFLHDHGIIRWQHAAKGMPMLGKAGNISACLTSAHPFARTNTVAVHKNTCLKQHIQHLNQLSHIFLKWWTRAASLAFLVNFSLNQATHGGGENAPGIDSRREWSEYKHEHFLEAQQQWKTQRLLFPKEQSIFLL